MVNKTCEKESSRNCGQINMVGAGLNDDNLNNRHKLILILHSS